MPASAMNRAEATFARSIKLRTVKHSAMTSTIPMSRPGAIPGPAIVPSSRRSRWIFTTFTPARGATSNETDAENLAAKECKRQGRIRQLLDGQCEWRDVDAGVPRRAQRNADRKGRRAGGLRARLPRRYLRFVRLHDQRRCTWSGARHNCLPADHAAFQ